MSTIGTSQVQKPYLLGTVYTKSNVADNEEKADFATILTKEAPPIKIEADKISISVPQRENSESVSSNNAEPAVPGIYIEPPVQPDENGKFDYTDPTVIRFKLSMSMGFPSWVDMVAHGGHNSLETQNERSEFISILVDRFKEVKDEFGCDDKSYLPYYYGLPEYDKDITAQMKASFYEKVKGDARAESLAGELGVLWPPERNTFETATGIDKFF